MEKAIWLSYDLGIGGDYEGLYAWLDNHKAIECGQSVAYLRYQVDKEDDEKLMSTLKKELSEAIKVDKKTRIYCIRKVSTIDNIKVSGRFLFGSRKSSPWIGYGSQDIEIDDSNE